MKSKNKTLVEFLADNHIMKSFVSSRLEITPQQLWYYLNAYNDGLPDDLVDELLEHLDDLIENIRDYQVTESLRLQNEGFYDDEI